MDQKQYMPACNSAFYDKGCCTRINEMMPREPYGGMKAFKTFTKSLAVELLRESIRGQLKTIAI